MPPPKNHRKTGHEKGRKGKLSEKAYSFHARGGDVTTQLLSRPRTVPELFPGSRSSADDVVALVTVPKLTKLLLNVTIQRSLGAVRVVLPLEATAEDLIAAVLQQYKKEARLPALNSIDSSGFDLHYSQFSLESLDRGEKLIAFGSRNFFLCPKRAVAESGGARCSKVADDGSKMGLPWLRFMEFSL